MAGSVGRSTGLDVTPSYESTSNEAATAVAPRAAAQAQVSAWTGSEQLPPPALQRAGAMPVAQLAAGLTAKVALEELGSLLTSVLPANLGVTGDDARAAMGLISSLSPEAQREVLVTLGKDRRLGVLVDHLSEEGRSALVGCARGCGLITEQPERHATPRTPQPPSQPALLDNPSALPSALRELVHGENQQRARTYARKFEAYVSSYCKAVKQAPDGVALRALGPLSTPPTLIENGVTDIDRKFRRWNNSLTDTSVGIERATKEVSNRISDFRGEIHAGGFALGLELTAKATIDKAVTFGASKSVDLTDDGRVLNHKDQFKQEFLAGDMKTVGGSASVDPQGHLKQAKVGVMGAGVEVDKKGKVTFSYKDGPVTVSSFVDGNAAKYGATTGVEESVELFKGVKVTAGAKATVTAQGIAREYYPDIGGRQEGVFGPMPELDQRTPWASVPKERQQWYARQGIVERSWPSK